MAKNRVSFLYGWDGMSYAYRPAKLCMHCRYYKEIVVIHKGAYGKPIRKVRGFCEKEKVIVDRKYVACDSFIPKNYVEMASRTRRKKKRKKKMLQGDGK